VENSTQNAFITLTVSAVARYREMMAEKGQQGYALRIRVVSGGCSGMQYEMGFEEKPQESDLVLESNEQKIFVDPKSVPYLTGTTIDYQKGLTGAGFKIKNPKAQAQCGCGESFS
jgi:iron-sulfur cluster assembly accessory protein